VLLEDPAVSSAVTVVHRSKSSPDEELVSTLDIEKSVLPSLVSFLQNFDSELLKGFQNTLHTKFEYLQRIRDENRLLFLCEAVQSYIQRLFPGEA